MVQYFEFPERKSPEFPLEACRKRKPTPNTESTPEAVFWKSSRLGGRQSLEGGHRRFIYIHIQDTGKRQ